MKFKGAWTILKKEMEFLGMTFDQLCDFIERNPHAQNQKTLEAYKVYKKIHEEQFLYKLGETVND